MTIDLSQYRQDARGNLVSVDNIKPIDLARDDFIREAFAKVLPLREQMKELKAQQMADANAFIDLSVEQYGAKRSVKGNITLTSFDGKLRIAIAQADVLHFDERLQAAKALIDECLNEWTQDSRAELKTFVLQAFDVSQEGKINVRKVLDLRKLDIADEKWQRAMKAIADSLHTQATREYIRYYQRNEETGEYEHLALDFARV
ncbi:DUF3164 family protein [Kingella bonacorsii]|jgi:hypothetical protein|uniref:DUF3164 family protein n=1 Tax=Kingella bonacorsii TaxID=2796361 RepID=A0ABS1BVK9_9NEIS|nr:DUF3164 family protein [Kingella bonacorsii]MBK0397296.1 DUF3164 family protein [Kingella bonacorsii]DAS41239.1 MAG TPA: Protein of unknown function (DUF3164) [Caudoviricetes sp.]